MIEITIKVRSLMQVMQVLCFAAVVVSIVTDDTSTTQRLGHWIAIIGEGFAAGDVPCDGGLGAVR